MESKKYDEVWAVEAERIRAFFDESRSDHVCDADAIPMPSRSIGPMSVPQTRIIISGEGADELYRRFCLKFMTAGG